MVSMTFYLNEEAREKGLTLGIPRDGDAGFDLPAFEEVEILPKEMALIRTGVHLAIPRGWVGLVRDRSSVAAKKGGAVTAGVIDAGYRGEVKVVMHNLSNDPIQFSVGDRIAQCIVIPHLEGVHAVQVSTEKELGSTERGEGGFGSTGI
ncbi:MAG TPA: dUTP diphosphatase [Oligoflexia bacterium]|nr:dUTP diphosphatase [Oligoflexia bacterium]HMP48742.1 dUTP diphosphatase [Oligoflexia bacterium]